MHFKASALITAVLLCIPLLCAAGCGNCSSAAASPAVEISAPAAAETAEAAAATTAQASDSARRTETAAQTTAAAAATTRPPASEAPAAASSAGTSAAESAAPCTVTTAAAAQTTTAQAAETVPPAEPTLSARDLAEAAGDAVTKLMIVAHPDDETIWGGAHLLEGGYLVLCITNGDNAVRAAEFQKAVRQTGNIPLMLQYPDKTDGVRDGWQDCTENIRADIRFVLSAKRWVLIATHNPCGEYGHMHHRMVSRLTAEEYESLSCEAPLCFFGAYYTRAELESAPEAIPALPDDILREKKALCRIYASQSAPLFSFAHMLPYENWSEYAPC